MVVDIYNTDKKYNIIYADPPWNYRNSPTKKEQLDVLLKIIMI